MRRYLCLHLPHWPMQWLERICPETRALPAALFERTRHGPSLAACSREARQLGVRAGMPAADARALAPALLLHEWDRAASRQLLEQLCVWAGRFSPLAGLEPLCAAAPHPESLLLDITGCEQVFQGEENLLAQALAGLRKKNFCARAAIAPTLGAAWALAHCASPLPSSMIANDPAALLDALRPLPLRALRVEDEARAHLASLGIERVGELLKQPRDTLPSRFGAALLERIDQALGDAPEVLTPLRPAPEYRAARAFEYPLRSSECLFKIVAELTARMARELQAAGRGARQIECWLYHEVAQPVRVEARLFKASASGKHLWKLLEVKLEDLFRKPRAPLTREQHGNSGHRRRIVIDADEGICAVALQILSSEKMGPGQLPLFDAGTEAGRDVSESLAALLDRLASHLGPHAVLKVRPLERAIPERAFECVPFQSSDASAAQTAAALPLERPLRLLRAPIPVAVQWPDRFLWRGKRVELHRVLGPERIESDWWSESPARRDYFIAESKSGARYWLFQRLDDQRWFLHGTFE